LTLPEERCSSS